MNGYPQLSRSYFTQLVKVLDLSEELITLFTDPDIQKARSWLKSQGWRRADRSSQGKSEELWDAPFDLKWTCCGISLGSAIKAQLRQLGYDTRKVRV